MWLEEDPLTVLSLQPLQEDIKSRRVKNYWVSESVWNWEQLSLLLPQYVLQKLGSVQLWSEEHGGDSFRWLQASNIRFKVKEAYELEAG